MDDQGFRDIHALPEHERLAVFDAIVEEKRLELSDPLSVKIKCTMDTFDRAIGQAIKHIEAFGRAVKLLKEKGPRGTRKKKIRWAK